MMIIPFLWIILMSFKTDSEILTTPFSLPEQFSLDNYKRALDILPLGSMYLNTMIIEMCIRDSLYTDGSGPACPGGGPDVCGTG